MPSKFTRSKQPAAKEPRKPKGTGHKPTAAAVDAPPLATYAHAGAERWLSVDVDRWRAGFADVEAAARGSREWPDLRRCAMHWHVAGVLYEGYEFSPLSDAAYNALSRHLLDNLAAARAAGAWLEEADLRAGTAMGWRAYPAPAHDVAYALARSRFA